MRQVLYDIAVELLDDADINISECQLEGITHPR